MQLLTARYRCSVTVNWHLWKDAATEALDCITLPFPRRVKSHKTWRNIGNTKLLKYLKQVEEHRWDLVNHRCITPSPFYKPQAHAPNPPPLLPPTHWACWHLRGRHLSSEKPSRAHSQLSALFFSKVKKEPVWKEGREEVLCYFI